MAFINIFISQDVHISVKDSQLFLKNQEKTIDYPLEDVNSIMIENLSTTISTYTLSQFAERGILVYVCDKTHLPCGVVLPFCEHYHTLLHYSYQIEMSKPLQKQIWQSLIKNKIKNQNEVLNAYGKIDKLKALQESVLSGDSTNNEAKASLIYFKELFSKDFVRRNDSVINAFLNYGYAIVRGLIARSVVSHGLMPFLGVFHSNNFNQFNLVDDLLEIFRPLVDLFVKSELENETELDTQNKASLFSILNIDVLIDNQKQTVANAVDMIVESYVKSLKENKNVVKEVSLCGLNYHEYE